MKDWLLIIVATLLSAVPTAAQQRPGQPRADMLQECMMMAGASPRALLDRRESLGLTDQQVTRLEDLSAHVDEAVMPHTGPALQAHREAAALLRADSPDFGAYERKLQEAADHMIQTHVAMARAAVEALQVLTPEQRTRFDTLRPDMMERMRRPTMQGRPGMMGGGMMMPCIGPGAAPGGAVHRHR